MKAATTTLYFPSEDEFKMFQAAAAVEGKPFATWLRDVVRPRATKVLAAHGKKCPTCGAARKKAAA